MSRRRLVFLVNTYGFVGHLLEPVEVQLARKRREIIVVKVLGDFYFFKLGCIFYHKGFSVVRPTCDEIEDKLDNY